MATLPPSIDGAQRKYFDDHGLEGVLDQALKALAAESPLDPLDYLSRHFQRLSEHKEQDALEQSFDRERKNSRKERIVWMDGAFDLFHYGHMNAFRQGKLLGTKLIVGVNTDKSITECKGTAPLLKDAERLSAVENCKFVDVVEPDAPYIMNPEYLQYIIKKFNVDYVVHGDDPCIVDGKDVYAETKENGMYRSVARTEGVSTTDIVGRMLLRSKDHHTPVHEKTETECQKQSLTSKGGVPAVKYARQSTFLTTNRMLRLFSQGTRDPNEGEKIVYVAGAFDMLHAGLIAGLKAAKEKGDYLIVGVHNDMVVNSKRGSNMPILSLLERVLSVLGCQYVDDVLIDAPWVVTKEMVASLNLSRVVHMEQEDAEVPGIQVDEARFAAPKELGILEVVPHSGLLTLQTVISRIEDQKATYEAKFAKKSAAEAAYYSDRYGLEENEQESS